MIDFGSPNVAKPMHVGHIRSTVLGDALARIATFLGHEVIRDNHIGDWGTQFGMVIWGWKNLLDRQALERDPLAEIVRIYKETNERSTADPSGARSVPPGIGQTAIGRQGEHLTSGTSASRSRCKISSTSTNCSISTTTSSAAKVFTTIDSPGVVERLLKSGIAEISEGAVCVFFRDIPELADKPCIIRKRDGGYNYATTDIATVDYRINELKADTVWIVTGAPQILHFKQIFEIARREGYKADFRHITHGNILGEDRKLMKTRSGENVPLRRFLEEAIARARGKSSKKKIRSLSDDGEDRHRAEDRYRRGQVCRSLAISDDRLRFFLGQNVVAARKHRAVFAKRIRADSLNFSQSRRSGARRSTSWRSPDQPRSISQSAFANLPKSSRRC